MRADVVLVTGAARGIGAAVAAAFVAGGASVVVSDVLDAEGRATAESLGERAFYQHLDVTSESAWKDAVTAAEERFGPVTVLVNNAGIVEFGRLEDQSVAAFRRVVEVNLVGAFLGIRAAATSLRRAGGGTIVNISSTAGLTGYSDVGSYVASKWGLRGLTKTAALELAGDAIRVCSVHPGPIHTPMTAGMDEDAMVAGQPLRRFGEPEEVAETVRFVATTATYTTGAEFLVDGGTMAGVMLPG